MNQESVLIIADEAEFARAIMERWRSQRAVPGFTLVSSDLWKGHGPAPAAVNILGPVRAGRLPALLRELEASSAPALFVSHDPAATDSLRAQYPRITVLRHQEGWAEAAVLLAQEMLRRVEAQAQLSRAEQAAAASQRHATLGRYMLDMRHSFNNALTSVLGNAELLLLEPGAFSAEIRDQISTIHSMALRLHEIMQRFSSIETEMQVAEKESHIETKPPARALVSRA